MTRKRLMWLGLFAISVAAASSEISLARTTTYTFTAPPDSVLVRIPPSGAGITTWPAQILDTQDAFEDNQNVLFDNEINNTIFFDRSALMVTQSTRMQGNFGWGDPRNNGPLDPSVLTIDFTTRQGGIPHNVSFDFAVNQDILALPVQIIDSAGDVLNLFAPRSGTFTHGSGTGSDGRAILSLSGAINNIAKIRLQLPVDVYANLQVGVDNLTFDDGFSGGFDNDGDVDAADLAIWRSSFRTTGNGDADNDGDTDGADFLLWQRQLGSSALAVANPVPEPSAAALVSLAFAAAAVVRNRPH